MDKRIEWPWSLEEEAEWKSELATRDEDMVDVLIDDEVEDVPTSGRDAVGISEKASAEDNLAEKYSITA